MLKVWGRRSSFNVQKVMWLVDELGLAHEHIDAGGKFGGLDAPGFLAMNPHGKVPVIDDDGTIVWESHAILRYLAARHGGARWWPEDAGRAVIGGPLDGLVGDDAATGFPDGRVLGVLSHTGGTARSARDPRESRSVRLAFPIA